MRLHRCAPTCYGTTHRWCVESCTDWCVIFTDRGSQHAPEAGDGRLGARRTAHDVRLPAGETGPRHDNAVAESFLGTSEDETCHPRGLATRKEARLASAGYVEGCHDRRRPHPAIDYHIPAEEMDALFERMDAMVAREEALPLAA